MGFLSDLFGGKSGIKAANQAAEAASAYTNAGYGKQRDELTKGYGQADTILSGYEQPGQQAYGLYADSIGVNGADGYGRAKASFDADPFRAGTQDATNRAIQSMFRRYNPTGQTGTQMAAVGRVGADRYAADVEGFRNRLMGLGSQGAQFGTARAGNAISLGQEMGGSYLGQNNQLANVEQQRIAGVQAAKQQGQNNIMAGIGTVAGLALAPFTGGASLGLTASSLGKMGGGGGGGNPLMAGYGMQGSGYMGGGSSLPWTPNTQNAMMMGWQ